MKPSSVNPRSVDGPRVAPDSLAPSPPPTAPADVLEQHDAPPGNRSSRATDGGAAGLREPAVPKASSLGVVRLKIEDALQMGAFDALQDILTDAEANHRLPALLLADGPAAYASILDRMLQEPDAAHTHGLILERGADLLHAALAAQDGPRFASACAAFGYRMPILAAQDHARLVRQAAATPQALGLLLDHLPPSRWGDLLTDKDSEAVELLWRHAVRSGEDSAATRHAALQTLKRIFSEVPTDHLPALHTCGLLRRHFLAARLKFPAQLRELADILEQRGGNVPWGGA